MAWKWCVLLSLALLVAVAVRGAAADSSDTTLWYYANYTNAGALQPWINMPHGLREAATKQQLVFFDSNGQFDENLLVHSLIPSMVIVGFCLAFALIALCTCPFFFCCRNMGNCGGSKPDPDGYTVNQKRIAMAVMVVAFIFLGVGAIIGMFASVQMSQGVTGVVFGVNHTIQDAFGLPARLDNTVDNIASDLIGAVGNITSQITDVPSSLTTSFGPLVTNLTDQLRQLSTALAAVQVAAVQLDSDAVAASNALAQFSSDLSYLYSSFNNLSQPYNLDGGSYEIGGIPPNLPTPVIDPITFTNITAQLSYIDTLDLDGTADNIDNEYNNLSANVTQQVNNIANDVSNMIVPDVANVKNSAYAQINSTLNPVLSALTSVNNDINTIVNNYINTANYWRNVGTCILFGFSFLVMIFAVLGLVIKRAGCMTCGSILAFTLCWILWVFCALQYIIAAPIGKVCDAIQQENLEVFAGLLNNETLYVDLPLAFQVINNCSQPSGNLAGLEFNGKSLDSVLDSFQNQFQNTINSANFSGQLSQLDIQGQLDGLNTVTNYNLTGYQEFLNTVLNSSFLTQLSSYNGTVANSTAYLIPLGEALGPLTPLNESLIVLNQPTPPTLTMTEAYNNATFRISLIQTLYITINSTDIPNIVSSYNNLTDSANRFIAAVTNCQSYLNTLVDTLNNLDASIANQTDLFIQNINNNVIPKITQDADNLVVEAVAEVQSIADCYFVGQDYLAVINSFCVIFEGGLDATWWACGWVASFLVMVIVGISLVEKRWVLEDEVDDSFRDGGYMDAEMSPMGSPPPNYDDRANSKLDYA